MISPLLVASVLSATSVYAAPQIHDINGPLSTRQDSASVPAGNATLPTYAPPFRSYSIPGGSSNATFTVTFATHAFPAIDPSQQQSSSALVAAVDTISAEIGRAKNLTRQFSIRQSSNSNEGAFEGTIEYLYDAAAVIAGDLGCTVPLALSAIDFFRTLLVNSPVRNNVQFYATDGKAVCGFSSKVLLTTAATTQYS